MRDMSFIHIPQAKKGVWKEMGFNLRAFVTSGTIISNKPEQVLIPKISNICTSPDRRVCMTGFPCLNELVGFL